MRKKVAMERKRFNWRLLVLIIPAIGILNSLPQFYGYLQATNDADRAVIESSAFLAVFTIGSAMWLTSYHWFNRRQNRITTRDREGTYAGTPITRKNASRIMVAAGVGLEKFKAPVLVWKHAGPEILDTKSSQRVKIPKSAFESARFSRASTQNGVLGFFHFQISGEPFKGAIWVYDGYGGSSPITIEREHEFLALLNFPPD